MSYWFFEWLDDQYIETIQDAERVLSYDIVADDLRKQALEGGRGENAPQATADSIPVLAGRGLDLSESTDCIAACVLNAKQIICSGMSGTISTT
jgi:hypothetical protein